MGWGLCPLGPGDRHAADGGYAMAHRHARQIWEGTMSGACLATLRSALRTHLRQAAAILPVRFLRLADTPCDGRAGARARTRRSICRVSLWVPPAHHPGAGDAGLGGRYREGIGRNDQGDDLSLRTIGPGVRSLRYGARRHRRRHLRESRPHQPGPLPDHPLRGESPSPLATARRARWRSTNGIANMRRPR